MENSMEVSQKMKNRVAVRFRNLIPGHISRQNCSSKRHMHPNVYSSSIYNSQDMVAIIDRGMNKVVVCVCVYIYIYTHTHTLSGYNQILLSHE